MAENKKETNSVDALTLFIIIMGICTLVIGIWGFVIYTDLSELDAKSNKEHDNLTRMTKIVGNPSNKKFWGPFEDKGKKNVTPETFSSFIVDMADQTLLRATSTSKVRSRKRGGYIEHSIEQRFNGTMFTDIIGYVINVQNESPEVKLTQISMSNFKAHEKGVEPIHNVRLKFTILTAAAQKPGQKKP